MTEEYGKKLSAKEMFMYRCWACGKMTSGDTKSRCEECIAKKCVHCGKTLTVLRRVLEAETVLGDSIRVCTNEECAHKIHIDKLKPNWKKINE